MIRKSKRFTKPRKAYEKARINEENELVKKYGLKNKREIWKTLSKVNYFRSRDKALANSSVSEQEVLFNKLKYLGLKTDTIAEVLALKVQDLLERRITTVLVKKGLANTPRQARQMVTHKRVSIDNKTVNTPSLFVPKSQEDLLHIKVEKKKK